MDHMMKLRQEIGDIYQSLRNLHLHFNNSAIGKCILSNKGYCSQCLLTVLVCVVYMCACLFVHVCVHVCLCACMCAHMCLFVCYLVKTAFIMKAQTQ